MIPLGVLASGYVAPAGGGTFSADDYTGCALWLQADALTGYSDGDYVATWPDSSAAGNDATGGGGGFVAGMDRGRSYWSSAVNGLPAIYFAGYGGQLEMARYTTPATASAAEQTLFAVVSVTSLAAVRTISGPSASGGLQVRVETTGKPGMVKALVANIGTSTNVVTASQWTLLTFTFSDTGNTYAHRMDGAANGSGSSAVSLTAGTTTVIGRNASTEPFVGYMAEVIKYTSLLNSTQIGEVEAYLLDKYAI